MWALASDVAGKAAAITYAVLAITHAGLARGLMQKKYIHYIYIKIYGAKRGLEPPREALIARPRTLPPLSALSPHVVANLKGL